MTKAQKLQLRISEIRQKLNQLSALETLTDEQRAEMAALSAEYQAKETEWRAAVITESEQTPAADTTGQGAEFRTLADRVSLREFLVEAATGREAQGAAGEFRSAVFGSDARSGLVPWEVLLEQRADTPTVAPAAVGATQSTILARVFAATSSAFLGVSMPLVGRGEANYPVLTAGATGAQLAPGAAIDAVAATFTPTVLAPRRLTARYLFRIEDVARLSGMEDALRADLSGALGQSMDNLILNGTGTDPNPSGILHAVSPPAAAPVSASGFTDFLSAVAAGVDGKWARNLTEIKMLTGAASYQLAAASQTATGDLFASDYLIQRSGGLMASWLIPVPGTIAGVDDVQSAIVYSASRGAGSAVAPVWAGFELIRDPFSDAASGQVSITAIMLWNFAILRADPYQHVYFKTAA